MFDGFFAAGTYTAASLWQHEENGYLYITNAGKQPETVTFSASDKTVRVLTDTTVTYQDGVLSVTVAPHTTAVLKLGEHTIAALYTKTAYGLELIRLYKKGGLVPYIANDAQSVKEFLFTGAEQFLKMQP